MRRAPIIAALAAICVLLFAAASARADETSVFRTNDAFQRTIEQIVVGESATVTVVGGGSPTAANFWVDTTGGTCTRQSSAGAYNNAAACSSIQVACAAASNGDYIVVKNGTYGAQDITCRASGSAPAVVVEGETKAGALFLGTGDVLDVTNTDHLIVKNVTVRGTGTSMQLSDVASTSNIVFDGVDIDGQFNETDELKLSGGNDNFTYKNGEIKDIESNGGSGGGGSAQHVEILNFGARGRNSNITFQDCSIHGHRRSDSGVHTESWLVWTTPITQNLTIDRCLLYDYSTIFMNFSSGIQDAFIIRNSLLEHPKNLDGTNPADSDSFYLFDGCDTANNRSAWVWEYNILEGPWVPCQSTGGGATLRGNVGSIGDCTRDTGTVFINNVWTDADCSASDVQDSGALDSSRFVNKNANNYHPVGSALCGKGDATSFPSVDRDLAARPINSTPDAGLYETC